MIEHTRRAVNGIWEELHRCRFCAHLKAWDETVIDNGFQLRTMPIVHVVGCPHRVERPSRELVSTGSIEYDAGL